MRTSIAMPVIAIGITSLAFWFMGDFSTPIVPPNANEQLLKASVGLQEIVSTEAVVDYTPSSSIQIGDLNSPVDELLSGLTGVVQVEVLVKADKPTHRIIHLRDWHFISKELFAIDMKEVHRRQLPESAIDRLYREFLLEVELVQHEQMAFLRCLIKHHGLKKVFAEGFSPKEMESYRERISVLKQMETVQKPKIQTQLSEVRSLLETAAGKARDEALEIESRLLSMLDERKQPFLEVGAAGRLLISGELDDVLPLEDADALENANPVSVDGVKFDEVMVEARHDAQVSSAIKEEKAAVIVLGGSHDLTASVERIGGGKCQYLRVTTRGYRKVAE